MKLEPETASHPLLERLLRALGQDGDRIVTQAERSLARLAERSAPRALADLDVLLPFGGGKDSAWTLAYVRLMQLFHARRAGASFRLHVLFMVQPGMTEGVFENVGAVFAALGIPDAPEVRVFATTLGGEAIELRFGSVPEDAVALFREEVLVAGHLAQGNGRETFCNGCNFALMNAIARYVVREGGALDFVITGDSRREVASYWKWVQRTAGLFSLPPIDRREAGWPALFGKLAEISDAYYGSLLGGAGGSYTFPHVVRDVAAAPEYFGVFEEASYEYWTHQEFLEGFLGFRLREDAFNFTESDCRNPLLMAHLRGLLADFEGRGYVAGVREYLHLVTLLMERKSYSGEMISLALAPYGDDAGILERRRLAEEHAWRQYGITPLQLQAMVASPLTDGMIRLESFLRWACPGDVALAPVVREHLEWIRRGGGAPESRVGRWVEEAFGLSVPSLRLLLGRSAVSGAGGGATELGVLRAGDPHKTRLEVLGQGANRIITGR